MELQKRLAAKVLKCGPNRIRLNPEKLKEIKEAITTFDINRLIKQGHIKKQQDKGVSRSRAKHRATQKRKGRRSGHGKRKGTPNARVGKKTKWVNGVRAQRELLKKLKDKKLVTTSSHRILYRKVKGGFFRSTKHIKLYVEEQGMITRK